MNLKFNHQKCIVILIALQLHILFVTAQNVYFIDGYHGGVYGHYPKQYTAFINETLQKNPDWKINLEIEPETWDSVALNEPENYAAFKRYFDDQSVNGRIEYVNPSYGQGYLYNINGESIIRQFAYGIKKLKSHFPNAVFTSYSSEEPCFTSALPQLLTSFGLSYASLKNPNTCWGGYTKAFGGEVVNWIGPDGSAITTVPRYGIEVLQKGSTWQTTASTNSTAYLEAAFKDGITNPVGMCLQDAGWHNGPWLGKKLPAFPTTYVTWRGYMKNIAGKTSLQDWHFSQEDVQVSLVWGAQVLQQIAKEIRVSENKIVTAEKLTTLANLYKNNAWPAAAFDEAWRGILLSQHHDCWIVPYNGKKGNTWIDKVAAWTGTADNIADSAIQSAVTTLAGKESNRTNKYFIRVFNGTGNTRNEWVKAGTPVSMDTNSLIIIDKNNKVVPSQLIAGKANTVTIIFKATVPSMGYNTYQLEHKIPTVAKGNSIQLQGNGDYRIETDLYRMIIDPSKGGTIKSLVAKTLGNKEFVDTKNGRHFNELKGYFFKDSSTFSSAQQAASVTIIDNGAECSKVAIKGFVNQQPFTQTITLLQGQPVIEMAIKIDWVGNPGIGNQYKQRSGYKADDYKKAFYNDSDKLQTLFPLNLADQKLYANAPFDVTQSKMNDTFFETWDSIKNNVLLNWVDVTDGAGSYGLALFSDHTTNYSHGLHYPLALTTQYSGVGLWGRNYSLTGPTEFSYGLLPHKGKWDNDKVWTTNTEWNNPMITTVFQPVGTIKNYERSLISCAQKGIEITAVLVDGNDLIVRLFNAEASSTHQTISFDGTAGHIELIELNGNTRQQVNPVTNNKKGINMTIDIPKFGVRTIRLSNFKATV